jgi:cell division topological specificity factor
MGLFDFLRAKQKNTARTAKERLLIIVAQERAERGSPDYLPLLKKELLEVIRKYVNVDPDAVQVNVARDGDQEVLELNVVLPEGKVV